MNINKQSIIILPFRNGSAAGAHESLCDGIAEALMLALSSNQNLRVISRKSAFVFKDQEASTYLLRGTLNVDFIVEGMVRLNGNKIRINASLIYTQNDHRIWSEKWDRKVSTLFELEDEIALHISDRIREHVGHFDIPDPPKKKQKTDFTVYQKLLEAKFLFYKWNPMDMEKALALLKEVLAQEPDNIEALVSMADAYSFMAVTNFMKPPEAWELSAKYTEVAYQLNPKHAGVHYLKANSAFFTKGNFSEALKSAHKAVALNPSYTDALQLLTFFYTLALKEDLALEYLEQALNIDPLNQETLFFKALVDYRFGQAESAVSQFSALIEQNPNNLPAIVSKSYALIKTKQFNTNLAYLEALPAELLIPDERLGLTCVTHAAAQNSDKLVYYLPKLQIAAREPHGLQAKCYLYWTYCLLNKTKEAMQIAQNMQDDNISLIAIHFADPIIEAVLDLPEFKSLFAKIYQIPNVKSSFNQSDKVEELPDAKLQDDAKLVRSYMEEEELFLNPKLSLRGLAQSINIHPNRLSAVLNSSFEKNFNSFVNDYRIAYFKDLLKNQTVDQFSLIALAYESGFNSKTVFNTYFKKKEGVTPKEYLKKH